MKPTVNTPWITCLALALSLPTAFFILIAVLKYGLGVDAPFDVTAPFLERMGIKETIGWNINLLILFGPLVALMLTLVQLLSIQVHQREERIELNLYLHKHAFPLFVASLSVSLLAILFVYALGENCQC